MFELRVCEEGMISQGDELAIIDDKMRVVGNIIFLEDSTTIEADFDYVKHQVSSYALKVRKFFQN